jgi:nucleotidyltransferase/DNA polymerase involved in DNA repair
LRRRLENFQNATPSPGTPGEGRGEGDFEHQRYATFQNTLTPTLSRSTGRGGNETAGFREHGSAGRQEEGTEGRRGELRIANRKLQIANLGQTVVLAAHVPPVPNLQSPIPPVPISCLPPPLVIVRTIADRQVIVSLCDLAAQRGIRRGMTLTQARALCADVEHAEHDPPRDRRALEALGRWLTRFTPTVALDTSESADGIFLDITGCERLFGSVENIAHQVMDALSRLCISARVAVAPTPGAAWALAVAGENGTIATDDTLPQMLAPLPPAALRISDDLAAALHHLGLVRIGQVIDLPRGLLPARFGPELLLRIDQALGHISEPLVPLEHLPPIVARMDFDGGVSSLEAIWATFQQLIGQIIVQLTRRGCGIRQLDVELLHLHEPPVCKSILLSRPSRDAVNVFNLFRCAMEEVEGSGFRIQGSGGRWGRGRGELGIANCKLQIANFGEAAVHAAPVPPVPNLQFEICNLNSPIPPSPTPPVPTSCLPDISDDGYSGMILRVSLFEPLSEQQISLLGQEEYDGQLELDRLIERLRLRLGEQSVVGSELVESHIPERAWEPAARDRRAGEQLTVEGKFRPALPSSPSCLRASVPSCLASPCLPPLRPLHLFPQPIEIRVMVSPSNDAEGQPATFTHEGQVRTIVHAVGPERIAGRWWDGHDKTRDYFDVEDTAARRFWLFRVRETGRWYLHGGFG